MHTFPVADPTQHLTAERYRWAGDRVAVFVRYDEHGWPGLLLADPAGAAPEWGPDVHGDWGGYVEAAADGGRLVCVADPGDRLQVIDRVAGRWTRRQAVPTRLWPDGDQYGFLRLAVAADGRTAVCYGDTRGRSANPGRAEVWRVSDAGRPNRLADGVTACRLGPVGGAAVSGGDRPVVAVRTLGKPPVVGLWDVLAGDSLGAVPLPTGRHRFGPRFAAAGTGCVVGAGLRLLRFDARDLPGQPAPVATDAGDAALSPDGTLLVTAHPDGTVGVWDAGGSRTPLDLGFAKQDPPVSVDVSADGLRGLAGSAGGRVVVWDLG